jgi:hypothetical protein
MLGIASEKLHYGMALLTRLGIACWAMHSLWKGKQGATPTNRSSDMQYLKVIGAAFTHIKVSVNHEKGRGYYVSVFPVRKDESIVDGISYITYTSKAYLGYKCMMHEGKKGKKIEESIRARVAHEIIEKTGAVYSMIRNVLVENNLTVE